MEKDLKWIKKHYGEEMMHLCRELFPRILEIEGLLTKLLKEHFPNNHYLAMDIKEQKYEDEFKNYIYSLIDVEDKMKIRSQESAIELMDQAGYILYPECKTEQDVQSFKKWWKEGEELCTFKGGRLDSCRVWFAIKKNAKEINREDFKKPTRQDEYGTSVISIQFSKNKNQSLSIKNRYNHSVNNPDNTFNSNLDNIIQGLTDAFERDYDCRDEYSENKTKFELENYVCVNGKYYHYNCEINNIYYCDDGVIFDNFKVKKLPEHQMLIDCYIVDFNKKTISFYDKTIEDPFCEGLGKINQMLFAKGVLKISADNEKEIEIGVSPRNEVVSYKNHNLQRMNDGFMFANKSLKMLDVPNLQVMEDDCFSRNEKITELNLPNLQVMMDDCFSNNKELNILNAPKLQSMGENCFYCNEKITKSNTPNLRNIGDGCFCANNDYYEELCCKQKLERE